MKELICIVCPRGCHLKVDSNLQVTGNGCSRGNEYGKSEITNPIRMVTSTVKVEEGDIKRLSVITKKPIPKSLVFKVMEEINKVVVKAPVNVNDIIISNILDLGVDIVSTKTVKHSKI